MKMNIILEEDGRRFKYETNETAIKIFPLKKPDEVVLAMFQAVEDLVRYNKEEKQQTPAK